MAIASALPGSLRLKLNAGVDNNNKYIIKTCTYTNLVQSANNQDVFDVAEALANLSDYDIHDVQRVDKTEILK